MVVLRITAVLLATFSAVAQQAPAAKPASSQPIAFSHKTHSATGLKCQECHPNPDPGDRMTIAAASRCMACHITIAKDRPAIRKLAEFAKSKETIPWVRIYSLPAEVYWNHRSHLKAGVSCEACHGPVARMEVLVKNAGVTTMGGCVECHTNSNAGTGCGFCHEEK